MSSTTCRECGAPFTPARADARFCSSACRQRAYRSRNTPPVTDAKQPNATRNAIPVTDREVEKLRGENARLRAEVERPTRNAPNTEPPIDWDSIPASAKEKLESFKRRIQRQLEREFEPRIEERVREEVRLRIGSSFDVSRRMHSEAQSLLAKRRGVFNKSDYNLIRSSLHPDSRHSISDEKLAEAFRKFDEAKLHLLAEKDDPRVSALPTTLDELLKQRKGKRR